MSCGCANRMRQYVLPGLGFVLDEPSQTWLNPTFPDDTLQSIPDADIKKHHLKLTVELAIAYSVGQFRQFWAAAYDKTTLNDELYTRILQIADDRVAAEKLSTTDQWIWFAETWLLPALGYQETAAHVWTLIVPRIDMPTEVTYDNIGQVKDLLIAGIAKWKSQEGLLLWWNSVAPQALHLTAAQIAKLYEHN